MKVKRRIVLVQGESKSPLSEEHISFLTSVTNNNLGEVYKISAKSFILSFGARKVRESDIERSLLVSLALREHIEKIKMGVCYGLVSVDEKKTGSIKIEGALNKKVSHLLKIATWDQISVDDSITKIYSRIFDIRHLKVGKNDVYNVFGEKLAPSRIRGLKETYGKLIGRKSEFSQLENLILQIAADQGQIVGVSGEAGIGKTRFTHELKTILKLRGLNFFEGTFPYFGGSTYKGFKDIISSIANIQPDDSVHSIDKKLLRVGKKYGLEITDVNFLTNLYSLVPVSDTLKHLTEDQIKLGTFVAIKKLIFKISKDPLIIILEDMQNADELSVELSNFLSEGLPDQKLLFFMNYRPEFSSEFEKKIYFNPIKLKRFDEKQAKEFLSSLLNTEHIPKKLLKLILKKSAGNPLYIEELVRSLLDKGKIKVIQNELQLTADIETGDIQPTVHGVISYRMEKLPAEIRKTLKWASAIGDAIDIKLLKTILDRDISKDIETLEIRDFIVEKTIYPEEIYRFRHDLIREVAYESIPTKTRKQIHLKIGEYLEKKYKKEMDENIEKIANHFIFSSNYKKGFGYAFRTARKLKANYSTNEAIRFFKECLNLIEKTKIKNKNETKKKIIFLMQDIFEMTARYDEGKKYLKIFESLKSHNDIHDLARTEFIKARLFHFSGEVNKGLKHLTKTIELAGNNKKLKSIKIRALSLAARIYAYLSENKKAKQYALQTIKESKGKFKEQVAYSYERIGYIYHRTGQPERSLKHFEHAIEIFKQTNSLQGLCTTYGSLASAYFNLNKLEDGIKFLKSCQQISKQIGLISFYGLTLMNLGVISERMGQIKKAIDNYKEAEKVQLLNQQSLFLVMTYSNLCSIHFLCGDMESSKKYLKKSKTYFKNIPIKFWLGQNFYLEGKINLYFNKLNKAESLFNKAKLIFEEIKDPKKCADISCQLINLYSKKKDKDGIEKVLHEIKKLPKNLHHSPMERIIIAKLIAQLFFIDRKIIDPVEIKNQDNYSWDNRFELLSCLVKYFYYVKNDIRKCRFYFNQCDKFFQEFLNKAPQNLRDHIEKNIYYSEFFSEFKKYKK